MKTALPTPEQTAQQIVILRDMFDDMLESGMGPQHIAMVLGAGLGACVPGLRAAVSDQTADCFRMGLNKALDSARGGQS